MIEQVIIITIVGLLSACLGALLALRFQHSYWKNIHSQHAGWEHAQQGHQHSWEEKQEKLIAEAEAHFTNQIQHLHTEWQQWEVKDAQRIADHIRQQELSDEQARIERELVRLPRVEETSMVLDDKRTGKHTSAHWRPAMLQGANLAGIDLSHRYLGRADMRNAQLLRTNFFMADLSGACLADADLADADLSGANLSNADLRGATLTRANLLVADLNNAILTGANLLGARNLTTRQVYTALYDSTTSLDADIDMTLPRTSSMRSLSDHFPSILPHDQHVSSDNTEFAADSEPATDTMFEETMPAIAVIKLDKPELDQMLTLETPPFVVEVSDDREDMAQPEASYSVTENNHDMDKTTQLETSLPLAETIDDISEISHEDVEVSPATPSSPDDTSATGQEIHLLTEKPESKQPAKPVTPVRKAKRHSRKRTKVG